MSKYHVKSFSDPDPMQAIQTSKDEAVEAWANQMAAEGYRLISITTSPYMMEPQAGGRLTTVRNTLTAVVELIDTPESDQP